MSDVETVTPYSTVTPYATGYPEWIPQEDIERVQAYNTYEYMYWGNAEGYEEKISRETGEPIYMPTARTIVNTTAHYLLKGLKIGVKDPDKHKDLEQQLQDFLKREAFYSRFQIAKRAGVNRGDWIFHITADEDAVEGTRISLNSVDPGRYFPVWDPDNLDNRVGVRLVDQIEHPEDPNKTLVQVLEYGYTNDEDGGLVWSEEHLWETEGWNNPDKAVHYRTVKEFSTLDPEITQIPVYHFKNDEWDGHPFGNSELKGFERVLQAINESTSDEDVALALSGLGVYATDAGRPMDENGHERDWEVYPGVVLEVPGATMFKRVEGITSVTPIQDHLEFLKDSLFEASGTSDVALGTVDTATAESGIALAIKFMPTMAKIEHRDESGLAILTQMFYDLKFWFKVFEGWDFGDVEIVPELGDKLPINRAKVLEELNNMLDRKVISRAHYRREIAKLGYEFPTNIEEELLEEERKIAEITAAKTLLPGAGGRLEGEGDTLPERQQSSSNNTSRVNESDGNEATVED